MLVLIRLIGQLNNLCKCEKKGLMSVSHMLLSILSDTGLFVLLKPPWAEILSLIGLIGQLNNEGNL